MLTGHCRYPRLAWVAVLVILAGCIKLPTEANNPPAIPSLSRAPGSCSYTVPCTLLVTCTDPDDDRLAYQFEVGDPYYGPWLSEWTSYYPSGEEAEAVLEGEEGTYEVRVRARDTGNETSDFSNTISVQFGNAAPYPPEVPTGDTLVLARTPASFTTSSDDYEGDQICFRFDPGNGEPYSDWSALQSHYYDYDFSYAYPEAGVFSLRAQCKDENGNVSAWSGSLLVHVLENLRLVGSCGIPGGAEKVTCDGSYAYVSTSANGLQIVDVIDPSNPHVIGGSGTFGSSEVCYNGEAVFLLSVQGYDGILYSYDVSAPSEPQLLDQIVVYDGQQLDVEGDHAVIGTGWFAQNVVLIDVGDPASLQELSSLSIEEIAGVALDHPYVYAMEADWSWSNLWAIDITDPQAPCVVASIEVAYEGLVCSGPEDHVYVATCGYNASLTVVNVEDPANPRIVRELELSEEAHDIHCSADHLSIAYVTGELELFDVSNPSSPVKIGQANTPGSCKGVCCGSQYLYVADGNGGLLVYSYPPQCGRRTGGCAWRSPQSDRASRSAELPRISPFSRSRNALSTSQR